MSLSLEYILRTISLLNELTSQSDEEKIDEIKNLLCHILDNKKDFEKVIPKQALETIIYEATHCLRVFGFIKGKNKVKSSDLSLDNITKTRYWITEELYSAESFKNNLLDYNQKKVLDKYLKNTINRRLLLSAPTSFGKTFLLREIITRLNREYKKIVIILPTIALLNEVSYNLKELNSYHKFDYKVVTNTYEKYEVDQKYIFVLTPERVLKLLSDHSDIEIDFFFFDELHQIDENIAIPDDLSFNGEKELESFFPASRSAAFRISLYLLAKRTKDFYLAGPYLEMEKTLKGMKNFIKQLHIHVESVSFEPTLKIEYEAWKKDLLEKNPLLTEKKKIHDGAPYTNTLSKIDRVARYICDEKLGQTLLYCTSPGKTTNYALSLISSLPKQAITQSVELKDFLDHLKTRYNEILSDGSKSIDQWSLIKIISSGYGIHHGKLPKYIQKEIMRLFEDKTFQFLFCTSTIIEGVNTTAENVVVINNSIGQNPMTNFALKNIRGRAGRYYKNYIGRIFYLDRDQVKMLERSFGGLDYITFGDKKISTFDIDNVSECDFSNINQEEKRKRDKILNRNVLPDNVFEKNRLVNRICQEKIVEFLMQDIHYFAFGGLIENCHSIDWFLKNRIVSSILGLMTQVNALSEMEKKLYYAVLATYTQSGFHGLLKWEIQNKTQSIDESYMAVFSKIRDIIEYKVPNLLYLFEALFNHVSIMKGINTEGFSLRRIIQFYELGVKTELGAFLSEYGYPKATLTIIEKLIPADINGILNEKKLIEEKITSLQKKLDPFEIRLLKKALESIS